MWHRYPVRGPALLRYCPDDDSAWPSLQRKGALVELARTLLTDGKPAS